MASGFPNWEVHALAQGSSEPERPADKIRLYTMRFCPFSERSLLILAAKKIGVDIQNINLNSKPDWYLKLNPNGSVPTCVNQKGQIFYDSMIVAEYLDQIGGDQTILPQDPAQKAHQKMLVEKLAKIHPAMYGWWKDLESKEAADKLMDAVKKIDQEDLADGKPYLSGGSEPGWVDYMIWPWIERVEMVRPAGVNQLSDADFPNLAPYIRRMRERPEVAAVARSPDLHLQHIRNCFVVEKPDFDLGISV